MSISGIHGQLLELTVVCCSRLKNTEWISRQDPYVCLEYATTKYRTRTCTDGGKNPTFQEKFVFTLIEGLREMNVVVWNSNTLTSDDFIGSGKVLLHKVLSQGYDDSSWPLQTKSGRNAGEVRLIMHCASASPHVATYPAALSPYPPQAYSSYHPHSAAYPPAPYPPPRPAAAYPLPYAAASSSYPITPYPPSPHHSSSYPKVGPYPGSYPPPHYS